MEKQRPMADKGYRSFFVLVVGFNLEGELTYFGIVNFVSDSERREGYCHPSVDSVSLLLRTSNKFCLFSPTIL